MIIAHVYEPQMSDYEKGKQDTIEKIKEGLIALKAKGYKTYYIDDELQWLEQLEEQNRE